MNSAPPSSLIDTVMARNGKRCGAEVSFSCPFPENHNNGDAHPSARYHTVKQVWTCDACGQGGGWTDLCTRLEIPLKTSHRPGPTYQVHYRGASVASPEGRPKVVARYEYRDESGTLLRRKNRWQPGFSGRDKSFTWEKPSGRGSWTRCEGDGNPQVLYQSVAVRRDKPGEGEWDVVARDTSFETFHSIPVG